MEIEAAIKQRHATRLFDAEKPVPAKVLEQVVSLAQLAPSWVDSQPWKIYIATGQTLARIKQAHLQNYQKAGQSDWPTTPRQNWALFPRQNMARQTRKTAQFWQRPALKGLKRTDLQARLFDAPVLCYLTLAQNANNWSKYDLGAFGQTLMLAAQGLGLSSMPAYEIVRFPAAIRKLMPIPNNEAICMGIALGYPDRKTMVNAYRAPRVDLSQLLTIKK